MQIHAHGYVDTYTDLQKAYIGQKRLKKSWLIDAL